MALWVVNSLFFFFPVAEPAVNVLFLHSSGAPGQKFPQGIDLRVKLQSQ